jgi:nanoRNase/pAp phosphatase (c-di-AMP/oligoRNAs hydrolase)
MSQLRTVPGLQSERLLTTLANYSSIRIVAHDNPDPDALAAGWGLSVLLRQRLDAEVDLVAGGAIMRAENRHMVELLNPPIRIVDELTPDRDQATVLVDCGLGTTNHLATRGRLHPVAIIDHHLGPQSLEGVAFTDIRPSVPSRPPPPLSPATCANRESSPA